ncbi:hypothetical protein [Pseudoalteromonas mariniglutinosa]|uniref:hypothetical protein n=1 Tax=Pseudoalteromonas mariniglutinosa TaxID=206042 RepID=UPI00384CE444
MKCLPLVLVAVSFLSACSTTQSIHLTQPSFTELSQRVNDAEVVILTDHTLPGHLNLSSAGASAKERVFIDPAAAVFAKQLQKVGLAHTTLNVEEMIPDAKISTREQFDKAYKNYDMLLAQAVKQGDTLISLHFDADIIMSENYKDNEHYVGGVQIILDERAVSPETFKLSYYLIHDYPLFASLNEAGFRIRPGYSDKPRYQNNLTLNITGHSTGGGLLLELAPQDQAIRLYDTPEKTAQALLPSLAILAKGIADFRKTL